MSNIHATLRALLGREASLAELARCTNELLYSSTPGNKYVTAILLAVEPATGACQYVSAGHTEGLLLRASGKVERLPPTGLALGMFPGAAYDDVPFTIEAGDVLALYSDGVTEAMNEDEEEFGNDRLVDALRERADASAGEMVAAVLDRVDRFVGIAPQFDDITLLVLKRVRGTTGP
jgi:phosphoserine phosphatase RsbU/P